MSEAPYNPPRLGHRGLAWRIVVAALISGFLFVFEPGSDTAILIILQIGVGAVAWAAVFWRRRWPTATALITAVASSLSPLAAGPSIWALFSLATTRRWSRYLLAVLVSAVTGAILVLQTADIPDDFRVITADGQTLPFWPYSVILIAVGVVLMAAMYALIAAWGGHVGGRRELIWTLQDRAERAEAERDLRIIQARSNERERIAREMHDGLAHRISQITMHAGALAYRTEPSAAELRQSLEVIQESSHGALVELRDALGVLRHGSDGEPRRPLPSVADLPTLVESNRSAGMTIMLQIDPTLSDRLPEPLGRAIYRIAQEGITNAARHAPDATVTIQVTGVVGDHAEIKISNEIRPGAQPLPESGYGLIGLQERVDLLGGQLAHGRRFDRFVLSARLPWAS